MYRLEKQPSKYFVSLYWIKSYKTWLVDMLAYVLFIVQQLYCKSKDKRVWYTEFNRKTWKKRQNKTRMKERTKETEMEL